MPNNLLKCKNKGNRRWIALLTFFFFVLVLIPLEAQQKLKVDGDLIVQSSGSGPPRYGLIARPQRQPLSAEEGEIYYDEAEKKFRWFDGVGWGTLCSGEEYIVTRVVAAYNSAGSTRDGTNPCIVGGACVNPKADYTCNGAGDWDEISDAFGSLPAGVGGAVYLLEGIYTIDNIDVQIRRDNSALIGAGKGTVLRASDGNVTIAQVLSCSGKRILISRLAIDGNRDNNTNTINGIDLYAAEYCKFDKVWVENTTGYGIYVHGAGGVPCGRNLIFNSHFRNNRMEGIYMEKTMGNIISNNNIELNGDDNNLYHGMLLDNCHTTIISHNNIRYNDAGGILLESPSSGNIIYGNNVQDNQAWDQIGMRMMGTNGNIIAGNNVQGGGTIASGIAVAGFNTAITGNIVCNAGGTESIVSLGRNLVSGNRIYDSNLSGFAGESHYGIHSNSGTGNGYIFGNLIDGPDIISATFDRRMYDEGTATKFMDKAKITLERAVFAPTDGITLDVTAGPNAYVALAPTWSAVTLSAATAIANGTTAGAMLILEGTSDTNTVTIRHNANTVLSGGAAKTLGKDDTLSLVWNGIDWIEIGYCNNQ